MTREWRGGRERERERTDQTGADDHYMYLNSIECRRRGTSEVHIKVGDGKAETRRGADGRRKGNV